MTDILQQIRLCGILPCLSGGAADAVPAYVNALASMGFPAAEVDYPSFGRESGRFAALPRRADFGVIAKVSDARQGALALEAGARWIAMPHAAGAASSASLLVETEMADQTPAADGMVRLKVESCEPSKPVYTLRHRHCVCEGRAEPYAAALKRMWADTLEFSLVHIGINAADAQETAAIARMYSNLLGMPYIPGSASDYAGTIIEVMKEDGRGTHGHIGIATSDLERGMYFAQRVGFSFDPNSRKNDKSGRAILYYLTAELGGFAVHLLQK